MYKPAFAILFSAFAAVASLAHAETDFSQDFSHKVALNHTGSGGFMVGGTLGGVDGDFLLDTGASLITVSREFYDAMVVEAPVEQARRVAVRLASGRLQAVTVYRVERLTLGESCHLGPVEVAVLDRGGRNLLGMGALALAAPFAVYPSDQAPALALSQCGLAPAPQVAAI